ncbi:MAG: ribosomal protein S18-alanine N-acetyltransferase [Nitrosomonas sp.]|nr:ribosomal protein S18-alanine N-acetyltransferase [Nitrosomonas sp.]
MSVCQDQAEIREMCLDDLGQVILIEHEIFIFPWTLGNFRDSIKAGYHGRVLARKDNTLLMGYGILMMGVDEAHLLTLGIGSSWQKQGCGTRLLHHFIEFAGNNGARSVLLDVRASNMNAAGLYQSLGFEQIAVRKGYYPAMCGQEDALVMRLML